VNASAGYCNNGQGYLYDDLIGKARCLPDTANPSYQWGFSTMLASVFSIVHLVWAVTMYAIWQDAQFNSQLVKSGYALTQLRAAFALAAAARGKTGMENGELLRADSKSLEGELFGTRKKREAEVDCTIFDAEYKGQREGSPLRTRRAWPRTASSEG
jgi:hypothetical protein